MKQKIEKKDLVKKGGKTLKEFKEFISKGNVIDLAIGVIIGSAFGKIVSSIVDDILMPLIGILIGGIDFSNLSITVGSAVITYGAFIQNVIDTQNDKDNFEVINFNDDLPAVDVCCVYIEDFNTTATKKFIEMLENDKTGE